MKIITYPNRILENKAKKIKDPLDKDIQKLIKKMRETMLSNDGIGLAGPQVGVSLQICVIEYENVFYTFINPKITAYSKDEKVIAEEGCLSFPGKFLMVERYEKIKVRYLNEKGKKCKMKATGTLSRALQHEIDHLNGILFINKVCLKQKNKKN